MAALAALPYSSRAQCPDATGPAPDPATCPWTPATTYKQVPGTSCWATVLYCWRNCSTGNQVWVYEIDPDPGAPCDALTPQQLIDGAREIGLEDACTNFGLSPCYKGYPAQIVTTYSPSCWVAHLSLTSGIQLEGCAAFSCYCERTCDVCALGGGQFLVTNCHHTGVGYCDCPPAPITPWPIGECYSVLCN